MSQIAASQPDLAQTQLPEGSKKKGGLCGHMHVRARRRDGPLILAVCCYLKEDLSDSSKWLFQVNSSGSAGVREVERKVNG